MISPSNVELRLRPRQARVFQCQKRFIIVIAGRRWGKTTTSLAWLIAGASTTPGSICYYIAPSYRQAKRIVWRKLKQLIPSDARVTNEQELLIQLANDSIIQLHGADNPDSLRGVGLNFVVLDEFANMRSETWTAVVRPALSDQAGRALFISTPKGLDHFYDLYVEAQSKANWATFHFPTAEGGYVSAEELAIVQAEMDAKQYAQEFCATFENLQGRVYHAFDRALNVTDLITQPYADLLLGMDFNVNPMTAVVAQRAGDQCQVIDEILLPNSNTQEMMTEINRRYPGRRKIVYPDPSGVARKTSAVVGQTDFSIIRAAGCELYAPPRPYALVDRINSVNAMLCNAQSVRRLLISPRCRQLIKALDGLTYKDGTKIPDKQSGLDHITDALGYLISAAFPMVSSDWTVREFSM